MCRALKLPAMPHQTGPYPGRTSKAPVYPTGGNGDIPGLVPNDMRYVFGFQKCTNDILQLRNINSVIAFLGGMRPMG